jgi:hypothetical protein
MTGKALRIALLATPLLVGCASWRKTPAPEPAPVQQIAPAEASTRGAATTPLRPAKTTKRLSSTSATSQPTPPPAPAQTGPVIVTRAGASQAQPVPLFRQAIVLANVRAAVAGLPAQPKAEFQRGLLTLTFTRGTQAEMAAAVNRAFAVPEVSRIQVIPPP